MEESWWTCANLFCVDTCANIFSFRNNATWEDQWLCIIIYQGFFEHEILCCNLENVNPCTSLKTLQQPLLCFSNTMAKNKEFQIALYVALAFTIIFVFPMCIYAWHIFRQNWNKTYFIKRRRPAILLMLILSCVGLFGMCYIFQ